MADSVITYILLFHYSTSRGICIQTESKFYAFPVIFGLNERHVKLISTNILDKTKLSDFFPPCFSTEHFAA